MRAFKSRWRCSDKADKPAVQTVVGLVMTMIRMETIRMMMMMRRRTRERRRQEGTSISTR